MKYCVVSVSDREVFLIIRIINQLKNNVAIEYESHSQLVNETLLVPFEF